MASFFSKLFEENKFSDEVIATGIESLDSIRSKIIDAVYLAGAIISSIAVYATIVRSIKFGWNPEYLFQFFIFIITWLVIIFRKQIHLRWKAIIFFSILFISNTLLNITQGVISGGMQYIIVTTIISLLFGWRLGLLTIIITLIVRIIIGLFYYYEILTYENDLNAYAVSIQSLVTIIIGWIFTTSIIVFSINKFYRWLQLSLIKLSSKTEELTAANAELLIAKQKAEENDRLKSVFLANMSHEIRTPMNAIIGFSDLLAKKSLTEERKQRYVKLIQERSFDLLNIIQDILDISKIEVKQMNLSESEIKLSDLLSEIYEYYRLKVLHSTNKNELEIKYFLPDEIAEIFINVDCQRLKQILNNLIDNALKFTHQGFVEFGCDKHTNKELLFYVKDTGIGIHEEKYDIIFERFGQIDNKLGSRQYGGTGLGLSIVKGLLELMGGEIWFTSEVNSGTTFFFTLPIKISPPNISHTKFEQSIDTGNWHNKKILIVEDDLTNSEFLNELLSETGVNILNAYSGVETLSIVKNDLHIDLILMDIGLPDISGLQLTSTIKKERPEIIVIAQTAYAGKSKSDECLKAGCDNFISKPVKTNQLLLLMNQYLSNSLNK